ncbi:hypothetical protein LL037_25515 (plasmid) [Clostridium estertheticum]|uniref:Uncharacterized protein n=1 Tax=Clostridium estertheticum TaxID=238834 RepID=A0AA47EPX1_9CLOT|nr:hypothetical protein [Clostridium estertheticum]MBU3157705.1 hypothetical protein [Clostridium estertheticum]MBU3201990.1 hypothetical protein [Clostridium estertheticum]WAG63334.1 hypothetical protein LL038_25545 [Clostridium estertheticum]WAG68239.1 hypothetical protein LL037_25515 [Clostridium estertheticum]
MSKNSSSGSKGILSGLINNNSKEVKNENSKEVKNINSYENNNEEDTFSVKRSFSLRQSTVRKLQALKPMYDNINITFNEIVDEAIKKLYEEKVK